MCETGVGDVSLKTISVAEGAWGMEMGLSGEKKQSVFAEHVFLLLFYYFYIFYFLCVCMLT